ncbi:DNA-binding transcriptional MerR regulator [Anaerotaenia torta]|uniref:MerR family transcriptional regulator n=1 Tax=Anaerotaenia torta TaxID=433293 RepID=UPI003D1F6D5B
MELQTISQVSKSYAISSRMLRYYEQIGLIKSIRNEDNSYRLYDEAALKRVQQIIILRKLQIPVKQICVIMDNPDAETVIDIFNKNISELDSEITALSTIKNILNYFVSELEKIADLHLNLDFLGDDSVLKLAGSLSFVQKNVKDSLSMSDLNKASDVLNKLKEVRVVYLPPMTVASAFFTGDNSQDKAWEAVHNFIKQNKLMDIKPDLRVFRHERSNATGQSFGNEVWVSIPDDYDVPAPLTKKKFHGGQYAAHLLGDDGFLTYLGMQDWINESDKYQYDYDGNLTRVTPPIEEIDSFGGVRLDPEEIINYYNIYHGQETDKQYDVLFPVKRYYAIEDAIVEIPGSKEKCGFKASIITKNKFRIMGFTKIITPGSNASVPFTDELMADGRMDILNKYRKPGAPIFTFGSLDMDAQIRGGGHRDSVCLAESDITDVKALIKHDPYVRTIDASRWLIFELEKGDSFNDHSVCMKLGYTWNGTISGSFMVWPDGKVGSEKETGSIVYCWYPVKYE